jgi:hypothetical protein
MSSCDNFKPQLQLALKQKLHGTIPPIKYATEGLRYVSNYIKTTSCPLSTLPKSELKSNRQGVQNVTK